MYFNTINLHHKDVYICKTKINIMTATELIKKLQNEVNNHGDFELKVGLYDDEYSYGESFMPGEYNMDVNWDDRDNDWNGGWINISRANSEDDEDE